ncbi:hypothetical protein ACJX0J_008667 [Zea mays]
MYVCIYRYDLIIDICFKFQKNCWSLHLAILNENFVTLFPTSLNYQNLSEVYTHAIGRYVTFAYVIKNIFLISCHKLFLNFFLYLQQTSEILHHFTMVTIHNINTRFKKRNLLLTENSKGTKWKEKAAMMQGGQHVMKLGISYKLIFLHTDRVAKVQRMQSTGLNKNESLIPIQHFLKGLVVFTLIASFQVPCPPH